MSSFEILEYEDAYIELIELIEYNDKSELTAREGHYIRTMDCVNIRIEGRTKKEKDKDYRENNKETLIIKAKQYRIDNKEKIKQYNIDNKEKIKIIQKNYRNNNKEQAKQYNIEYRENNKETLIIKAKQYRIDNIEELTKKITCECGSICSKRVIPKHKRTKKHQEFIQIVSHTHL
jgi:type II secretory pathway component HofQ